MNVQKAITGKERHADHFEDGAIVFDGEGILVKVFQWNANGRKTFDVYVDGKPAGSTTNYPKAIGMGVIAKYERLNPRRS